MSPRLHARTILGAAVAIVVAIGIAIGCDHRDGDGDSAPVIDSEMMAYLSEARALHHQANLKEEAGDLQGASASMDRLIAARRPHAEKPTPEIEEVLADAHARLAELELKRNNLARADEALKGGLTHAPDSTYFRGHLLEIEGLLEEARSHELADAGRLEDAVHARERAIALLEEVVRIQDQVIQKSLAAHADGGR